MPVIRHHRVDRAPDGVEAATANWCWRHELGREERTAAQRVDGTWLFVARDNRLDVAADRARDAV
jgi:hypothetical protein